MSPLYTVFRFNDDKSDFYAHYFKASHWHQYMRQTSSTGARHDRMSITNDDFMGLPLPAPSATEQHKIAACLSSLAERIVAEANKLDTHKAHKKGLMQQIFPAEGEGVPRLRFPEFIDGAEWMTYPFAHFVVKSFYGTSSPTSVNGRIPVSRMGNMVDGMLDISKLVYIDLDRQSFEAIRLKSGDILLNRTNSLELVGKISLFDLDLECITASYIVAHRLDKERLDPSFCTFMLNTPRYQANIKALARPSISQANINPTAFRNELNISVPPTQAEQKKSPTASPPSTTSSPPRPKRSTCSSATRRV